METSKRLSKLRREYKLNKLSEETVHKNPFVQFEIWFNQILKIGLEEPNAMILATADKNGKPSIRTVLMKDFNKNGITFYTNYNSRKAKELKQNPSAALLFYWADFERQIRIEGKIKKISHIESEKYFQSRPLKSQIAAWASEQSKQIPDREFLEKNFAELTKKFSDKTIPLPPDWGGYRLVPDYFEFWQGRENRLHDRIVYKKKRGNWQIIRLAP